MHISEYYRWLKKDWAKTGFILSIYLLVFLFVFVLRNDFVLFILLLQTPLYMLHQTEEYIFPGGFGKYFNTLPVVGILPHKMLRNTQLQAGENRKIEFD